MESQVVEVEKIEVYPRSLIQKTGNKGKPSVIIIAGIHGNERAGIHALNSVNKKIEEFQLNFQGNFYALSGNLNALAKKIRFEYCDLNRIWTNENLRNLDENLPVEAEQKEQLELHKYITQILSEDKGPFYFIDLHTTSAETDPFITISDSINNRKFVSNFNIPVILGIEEFLEGPLLTYINEFGHIALGFEGGQHESQAAIKNCEHFIWQVLEKTQCLSRQELNKLKNDKVNQFSLNGSQDFYEIKFKYDIKKGEQFKMKRGYRNFDLITKNELLAENENGIINADIAGRIFMPLYQNQGNDGFFIIDNLSKYWLIFSSLVRKLKLHNFLRILPGIHQDKQHPYTLIVNPKTAKFMAIELFHLFGYRKKVFKGELWYFTKRDRKITTMI